MEIWKAIKDYEGLYVVSDIGKVKGLHRSVVHMGRKITIKEKILHNRVNNFGYKEVRLSKDGKTTTKFIHILKAQAFIPNPEGKKEVNHKDGNKVNNHISNLEWVTHAENIKHAYSSGLIKKGKSIIDTFTGKQFHNTKEASLYTGINPNTLKGYLNGHILTNPTKLIYSPAA